MPTIGPLHHPKPGTEAGRLACSEQRSICLSVSTTHASFAGEVQWNVSAFSPTCHPISQTARTDKASRLRIFVAALQHRDLRLRVLLVAQLNRRRDERGFHSSPYRSAAIFLDVPVTSEAELDFLHATLPSTLLA